MTGLRSVYVAVDEGRSGMDVSAGHPASLSGVPVAPSATDRLAGQVPAGARQTANNAIGESAHRGKLHRGLGGLVQDSLGRIAAESLLTSSPGGRWRGTTAGPTHPRPSRCVRACPLVPPPRARQSPRPIDAHVRRAQNSSLDPPDSLPIRSRPGRSVLGMNVRGCMLDGRPPGRTVHDHGAPCNGVHGLLRG